MNNYIILDTNDTAMVYQAEDKTQAICKYAEACGLRISTETFKKSAQALEFTETIELFNQVCLNCDDNVKCIFTGYETLYDGNK